MTSEDPSREVGSNAGLGVAFGAFTTNNERGRSEKCIGWFSSEESAKKRAANIGWYGGTGNVEKHPTITVDGVVYLLAQEEPIVVNDSDDRMYAARRSALAKMTAEERTVTKRKYDDEQPRSLG